MNFIEIEKWDRKEHFYFFQNRKNPCLCISFKVRVETVVKFRKENGHRFTDYIYYAMMSAANQIKEFRQRIIEMHPVEFGRVDAAFTYIPKNKVLHSNCIARFEKSFLKFIKNIQNARNAADENPTLTPIGGDSQGLIYLSCLNKIHFMSMTNPWDDPWKDTVPRIAFGCYDKDYLMPVSVEVLHSFIDGQHVAEFSNLVCTLLENPQDINFGNAACRE